MKNNKQLQDLKNEIQIKNILTEMVQEYRKELGRYPTNFEFVDRVTDIVGGNSLTLDGVNSEGAVSDAALSVFSKQLNENAVQFVEDLVVTTNYCYSYILTEYANSDKQQLDEGDMGSIAGQMAGHLFGKEIFPANTAADLLTTYLGGQIGSTVGGRLYDVATRGIGGIFGSREGRRGARRDLGISSAIGTHQGMEFGKNLLKSGIVPTNAATQFLPYAMGIGGHFLGKKLSNELVDIGIKKLGSKLAPAALAGSGGAKAGMKVMNWFNPEATKTVYKDAIAAKTAAAKATAEIAKEAEARGTAVATKAAMRGLDDAATDEIKRRVVARTVAAGEKEAAAKLATKAAANIGTKTVGKSLAKKLPFGLGLLAAIPFAFNRAKEGDWFGAAGEVASGAAATVPVVGTLGSAMIDVGLGVRDYNTEAELQQKLEQERKQRELQDEEEKKNFPDQWTGGSQFRGIPEQITLENIKMILEAENKDPIEKGTSWFVNWIGSLVGAANKKARPTDLSDFNEPEKEKIEGVKVTKGVRTQQGSFAAQTSKA